MAKGRKWFTELTTYDLLLVLIEGCMLYHYLNIPIMYPGEVPVLCVSGRF